MKVWDCYIPPPPPQATPLTFLIDMKRNIFAIRNSHFSNALPDHTSIQSAVKNVGTLILASLPLLIFLYHFPNSKWWIFFRFSFKLKMKREEAMRYIVLRIILTFKSIHSFYTFTSIFSSTFSSTVLSFQYKTTKWWKQSETSKYILNKTDVVWWTKFSFKLNIYSYSSISRKIIVYWYA